MHADTLGAAFEITQPMKKMFPLFSPEGEKLRIWLFKFNWYYRCRPGK
jgi:hypothetical protein